MGGTLVRRLDDAPPVDLAGEKIQAICRAQTGGDLAVQIFAKLDSTNDWLVQHPPPNDTIALCATECQLAGRGRYGRVWQSPSHGVTFSISQPIPEASTQPLSALGPVCAYGLGSGLADLGLDNIRVRWPNDVLLADKKLAGILLETHGTCASTMRMVSGIGINYRPFAHAQDTAATYLSDWLAEPLIDRSELIGHLAARVLLAYETYHRQGWQAFADWWRSHDAYQNQTLTLHTPQGEQVQGNSCGLSETGALQLMTAHGLRLFEAGEVSSKRIVS